MTANSPSSAADMTPWGGVTERGHDRTVLTLVGDIDLAARPELMILVGRLIDERPPQLVVDCSQVTFMDSSGLSLLCRLATGLDAPGQVVVRDPSVSVARLLEVSSLLDRFVPAA